MAPQRREKVRGLDSDTSVTIQTRRLRSRTETSPCSGQLSTPNTSEPTNDGHPGDNTRRLRSWTVKTKTSPCSGQLSTPTISELTIDGNPCDNTRRLRSRTVKTETCPCSDNFSTPTISEPTIDGNPGNNTRRLRSRTVKTETSPCSDKFSTATISELTIDGNPGNNTRILHSWTVKTKTSPFSDQLSMATITEPTIDGNPGDNTRRLRSWTVKTETSPCSNQLSTVTSEPIIDGDPGDNVADQVKVTSDGLPGDWIKEIKPRKKDSSRKDVFYIDPKTCYVFRSLKDALRYVETGNVLRCASRPLKRSMEEVQILGSQIIKTESTVSPARPSNLIEDGKCGAIVCKDVQKNQLTSHGLPKSWIKELKPRKNGSTKMDPFYVDPDTGYAFCSVKDALRYAATGSIRNCLVRPKKRSIEEVHALMNSPEIPSISGMKTVQHESLPLVREDNLHRKRKRSAVKSPDLKPNELKTERTEGATRTASWREKQHRERPLCVRASPRLLALKAKSEAEYDGNHEENNELCNTVPDMLNSTAPPDLNRATNSPPNSEPEEAMAENGNSTRMTFQSGKIHRERPMPLRASSCLAASKAIIDITSVVNTVRTMSNAVLEPTPCSHPYLNRQPSCHNLEQGEIVEGVNGSSTGIPLQSRKMCKPTALVASSRLAAPKAITDAASVENENSITNNALFEPSPSSLSYPNMRTISQEETTEGAHGSSTGTTLRQRQLRREIGKMRRVRRTTLRASSYLAAQKVTSDTTAVKNGSSMMSNALFKPSFSFSYQNLRPTGQPDLELEEETIEGAKGSPSKTLLSRQKMCRERPTLVKASSRLAAVDATIEATSVKNENGWRNNASFELPPSSLAFPTGRPRQPDLELEEERRQGADGSSTGTMDCPSNENKDNCGTNAVPEPPHSHPDLNLGPTSQPDWEFKEVLGATNDRGSRTILQRENLRKETPVSMRASSHMSALKSTTGASCDKNREENNKTSNTFSEVPLHPARPDLNFGPTSQPYRELEETIVVANGRETGTISCREMPTSVKVSPCIKTMKVTTEAASSKSYEKNSMTSQPYREPKVETVAATNGSETGTISRKGESCREMATSVKVSPCLKVLKVNNEVASCKCGENNNISNAFLEPSHFPGRPDLDFGPTSNLNFAPRQEMAQANGCAIGTTLSRMKLHGTRSTPGKAIEGAFHDNYGKNIERGNFLCGPVEYPASQIITGPTYGKSTERSNYFCGPVPASQISSEPAYGKDTERSNYFCGPVEYPASEINMGATHQSKTHQPNPEEFWLNSTIDAPSSMVAEVKGAPDLNIVPMSWPKPGLERVLESYPGPKLKQQQPASINTIGELRLQPPASSEILYQDPTMDALLGGQEAGPSMPHMSIDALNSPMSSFFGDFWHDPSLSYAFRTLTGGMRQLQSDPDLGPVNNYKAGAQNGDPSENPSIHPSEATSRNPHYRNNGMLFPK